MEPLRLKLEHPELDDALSRAYIRVEQYLCALRIHNKRILNELAHAINGEVRKRILAGDQRESVEIAMEAINEHVTSWYAEITGEKGSTLQIHDIQLSLFRSDLARNWSRFFLRAGDLPEEIREEMRNRTLKALPESKGRSNMSAKSLDLGKMGKLAEDTWRLFGKWPVLSAAAAGLAYLAVLAFVIYYASL